MPIGINRDMSERTTPSLLHKATKAYEKKYIFEALNIMNWDKVKTAKALGIGLSTLYRKLIELKIEKENA